MPSVEDFANELRAQIERATKQGRRHVEINAGELHRVVGGYPPRTGENHAMPSCCQAMRNEFDQGYAEIVNETESGHSASLTVRYNVPR
jgi:5-methylcytosine-specific restriction protein A